MSLGRDRGKMTGMDDNDHPVCVVLRMAKDPVRYGRRFFFVQGEYSITAGHT